MLSSLFLTAKLLLPNLKILTLQKIIIMLRDAPLLLLPNAPSDCCIEANALKDVFEVMHLNQTTVSNNNFSDDWGAADTEDAPALSGVNERRLNDCTVSALASVWGVLMMRPVQLKACFCLLHPHRPNSLVVDHWTGNRKIHILCTLGIIERGIILIFFLGNPFRQLYAQV